MAISNLCVCFLCYLCDDQRVIDQQSKDMLATHSVVFGLMHVSRLPCFKSSFKDGEFGIYLFFTFSCAQAYIVHTAHVLGSKTRHLIIIIVVIFPFILQTCTYTCIINVDKRRRQAGSLLPNNSFQLTLSYLH